MMESLQTGSVVRADAATEQERRVAAVAVEHRPVELSATAAAFANHEFGVKKMQEAYKSIYLHGSEARAVY